ncbi:MAG: hypothetical protein STHCBS139747_002912 [Sporothrix thermara]
MGHSSPLSSPPASSVLGRDDMPHVMSEEPDDASEIDLVLVSPKLSPPQWAPCQAPEAPGGGKDTAAEAVAVVIVKAPVVCEQEELDTSRKEELQSNVIPEPATESATQPATYPETHPETHPASQPASLPATELVPGTPPELASEPLGEQVVVSQPQPEPEAVAEPESIAAAATSSPSRYTNNALALVSSSSPNDTKDADDRKDTPENTIVKEDQHGDLRNDKQVPQEDKTEEDVGKTDTKGAAAKAPRAKARSRPRPQSKSKTPPADASESAPAAPAVTTTRSGRRVVQKRHLDEEASPGKAAPKRTPARAAATRDTNASKATPSKRDKKREASPAAAVLRRRKQAAARWQTGFVLTNTRSPLTQFDLRTLLCQPEAWTLLSADEQKEVLALFPASSSSSSSSNSSTPAAVLDAGTDRARPDVASLKNDNNFRHDCARYRSDLQAGFFNIDWLEEAFEAHAMRQEGVFDAYVLEAFESNWGVKVPKQEKAEEKGVETEEKKEARVEEMEEVEEAGTASRKRGREASVTDDSDGKESSAYKLRQMHRKME